MKQPPQVNSSRRACPQCGGNVYRRNWRGWLERTLTRLTRRRPYACSDCGWRGYLPQGRSPEDVIDRLHWFRVSDAAPRKRKSDRS